MLYLASSKRIKDSSSSKSIWHVSICRRKIIRAKRYGKSKSLFQRHIQSPVKYLKWSFLSVINHFCKMFPLRWLTGFWISLCFLKLMMIHRSSHPEIFYKKGEVWNFRKETPTKVFSCDFCKIFKSTISSIGLGGTSSLKIIFFLKICPKNNCF